MFQCLHYQRVVRHHSDIILLKKVENHWFRKLSVKIYHKNVYKWSTIEYHEISVLWDFITILTVLFLL